MIGNLCDAPEAYTTKGGVSRSTFRIAVQRKYKNANNTYDTDFFTVIAWRQTAEFCNKYLTKGRKVAVEGSIENRTYDAQDGSKRYVTEIIADSVEAMSPKAEGRPAEPQSRPAGNEDFEEVDDDELPFD